MAIVYYRDGGIATATIDKFRKEGVHIGDRYNIHQKCDASNGIEEAIYKAEVAAKYPNFAILEAKTKGKFIKKFCIKYFDLYMAQGNGTITLD